MYNILRFFFNILYDYAYILFIYNYTIIDFKIFETLSLIKKHTLYNDSLEIMQLFITRNINLRNSNINLRTLVYNNFSV